ncbi:hypothetical protein D3C80_769590 [compost metagenome]
MKALFYAVAGAAVLVAGAAEAHQAGARFNAAAGYRGPVVVQSRAQSWYSDSGWQGGYGPVEVYGYDYGYGGAGMRPPLVVAGPHEPIRHGGYSGATRSMPFGYPVDGYGRYPWTRWGGGYAYGGQYHGGYGPDCGRCGPPQPAHYRPEPIYVSPPPIYVSQPPVYVQSPPIYVQPAPVYVAPAQVEIAPPQVHVAPPQVEVAPPRVDFEQGYYAVPAPPPPPPPPPPHHHRSPTERPYLQERGERG